jgi:hypothetical protein
LAERLAAFLKERAAFYHELGPLGSVTLVERRDEGADRLHRYRLGFKKWTMLALVRLNQEGKIAGLMTEFD